MPIGINGRPVIAPPPNRYIPLWPASSGFRGMSLPPYGGYLAHRQSRFYLRGLRRDGLFFENVPLLVLWTDDDADSSDIWLA